MNKIIALFLAATMMLALCACGARPKAEEKQPEPAAVEETVTVEAPEVEAAPAENSESAAFEYKGLSEEITAAINNASEAVYAVHSGTAGSSLRTMAAAGKILDLSKLVDGCDASEFEHICRLWLEANLADDEARSEYCACFTNVSERVKAYLADPAAYEGEIESCGYAFAGDYSEELASWVLNYMAIAMATGE